MITNPTEFKTPAELMRMARQLGAPSMLLPAVVEGNLVSAMLLSVGDQSREIGEKLGLTPDRADFSPASSLDQVYQDAAQHGGLLYTYAPHSEARPGGLFIVALADRAHEVVQGALEILQMEEDDDQPF